VYAALSMQESAVNVEEVAIAVVPTKSVADGDEGSGH
jgi:hypothetical protein